MFRREIVGQMFAALSATNEAILRNPSPADLYQSVCDAAVQGGGFITAAILLSGSETHLHAVAGAGAGFDTISHSRIDKTSATPEGRGLAGEAFRVGRTIVSNDFQADSRLKLWKERAIARGIHAGAAVPIRRGESTIGILLVYLGQRGSLTDDVVVLLERMVDNIRFALDNFDRAEEARTVEHARHRLSCMFASLSAMNEAVLRAKTIEEMFKLACDAASDGGRLFASAIFLREDGSKNLRLVASAGKQNQLFKEVCLPFDPDVSVDDGFHGPALRTGKPVICLDPKNDPRSGPWMDLIVRGGVTSLGYFPLFRRGRAIGVFLFSCRNTDEFQQDAESLNLMSRMAQNITFGIDMFAEQTQRERLSRMLAALSETNEAILRARSQEELLPLVCEASARGGQFNSTTIFVADQQRDYLRAVVSPGPFGDYIRNLQIPLTGESPEARGVVPTAFRTGKHCVVNEFQRDPGTKFWAEKNKKIGSGASFPLRIGNDFGVLLFLSAEADTFTPDFVELLDRLAGSVSVALEKFKKADEKRLADEQIAYLASHDRLTDLPNRGTFGALLKKTIESEGRNGGKFALLFIDLDRFKIVNDSLGHEAGDRLLVETAGRLKKSLGADDFVARLGGDEFVAIVRDADNRPVEKLVSGLLRSVAEPVKIGGHECYTTASIGVCLFPDHGTDEQALLRNSDAAMYRVKENGKNGFSIHAAAIEAPSLQPKHPEDPDGPPTRPERLPEAVSLSK
ncbi:GGDEF domain-containing protein [Bradyrhizobium sp. AUGA SZCCT0240]|uniref:sensor domain-containing diguanylate cyclase n=1 Tax=Bradyrhizobium sp. AUGA SZCCT0240 TaxID=2807669 RepID=UPI001BA954B7|nr:sensor domain-containing diguanylate cyclase [Bradyrhizobium sp. AUGA SZCCT0240]MBR1252335.1 GGDEF domain-containing protein [Bradyrhizobium sp. AUGA SZCCT0240]